MLFFRYQPNRSLYWRPISTTLRAIHNRALERDVIHAAYIEELVTTYNDEDNRAVFAKSSPLDTNLVALALRAEKKIIDKVAKGAGKHP